MAASVRGLGGVGGAAAAADRADRAAAVRGRADRLRAGGLADAGGLARSRGRRAAGRRSNRDAVEEEIAAFEERILADRDPDRDAFAPEELLHSADSIRERLSRLPLRLDRLGLATGEAAVVLRLPAEAIAGHAGRAAEAAADLTRALESGEEVFVAARPTGGVEKLRRLALEYGFHVSSERRPGAVVSIPAEISAGFRLREPRLAVYAEEEIFGEERRSAAARRKPSEAFLSDLRDLKLGDAVVHADYGIGLFKGLKRVPVEGAEREFMEIEYAEAKRLLLPVERLDLVQKYSGVEGVEPMLDRLGGAGWAKRKASVRKAMRDMTDQLLKLYARRSMAEGFAFSKDAPWQKEFEDAFEYVETPDQAQAIADVKRDMQSTKPMDRLLCGDVGYGKTEVAMRAAFKAVLDGKQVAVLAPTTILADQHFRTFRRRFAAFPVSIELLSRFRSRAEQKEIVAKVAEGSVDILIATHRMLGKDLAFRDLGLLIVDEEQRFGVAQKERLKEWKASIDVLSMSATPIPRSLHLSLSGLRDLSIIETPPRDRLAIETQVVPSRPEVIREAIEAEIGRGGQVFFVHNRIESIGRVKQTLEELLPSVRVTVAHGQMPEAELEKAMLRFFSREADVLLATAIVENGLDIPSANTILIDRADTFGLAQLYQLRGRVGRSDKPAYAYLLVDETAGLSEIARRRLASIQEFCDLGAGFRIAAKDLEIRGSGNILGGEQSGHIAAVGFETYLSLLEEAIREMRGEEALPGARRDVLAGARPRDPARLRGGRELADDDLQEDRARPRRRRARGDGARDRRPLRRPAAGRAPPDRVRAAANPRRAAGRHVDDATGRPRPRAVRRGRPGGRRAPARVRPGDPGLQPLARRACCRSRRRRATRCSRACWRCCRGSRAGPPPSRRGVSSFESRVGMLDAGCVM